MHQANASIVVGTDGSETASVAVAHAGELAKLLGASVHLVCAFRLPVSRRPDPAVGTMMAARENARSVLEEAAGRLRATGVRVEIHPFGGDAAMALLQIADANHAELIVIGNKGMSGAGRYLLGSVPNKISHHASCNVLIVRTS
jgi:nucleotide-binding universal stress UspA family protein